ncbi:FAD-dependent monooxygenase [Embleya sp. AB8]|uniref:FAD-dependent monooxygenase n=1 Tax=Embleya sp. AB8 TaxID=3156304 RepID=UPI003C72EBCC
MERTTEHTDDPTVVIAGGGPSGLMLACELALAGVRTIVLERLVEPPGWSRALGLQYGSIRALNQRGLAAPAFEYAPVKHFGFGMLRFTGLEDHLVPRRVPQRRIEQHLEEHAIELGVDVRRGHEVVDFTQDDSGVLVTVRTADGEYELPGAYLAGADGGASVVRKRAGIDFPGTPSVADGITGDLRIPVDRQIRIDPSLHPSGMFALIPLDGEVVRVTVAEFGATPTSREVPVTEEELHRQIGKVVGREFDLGTPQLLSRFGSSARQAERYREGRVILLGDAAHVHFPIGGQGLNTGLQDALNLGWKLAATVRGWAPEGLLDTYAVERHPVAERVLMNTRAQLALMYPLEEAEPLREVLGELLGFEEVSRHLVHMMAGVDIRYPVAERSGIGVEPDHAGDPGAAGEVGAHPLLGERLPDAALRTEAGETTVDEILRTGRAVLLDLSAAGAATSATDADPLDVTGWKDRVDVVQAAPVSELAASAVLIRPDGYAAWVRPVDVPGDAGLRRALTGWLGLPG